MRVRFGVDERLPRRDASKSGRAASECRGNRTDTSMEQIADIKSQFYRSSSHDTQPPEADLILSEESAQ